MSEVKVNKISPRTNCGTVQLGDSGDTITIPAGATIVNNGTQTGFGRTGTVNWDTTAKTASFTAVSGNGYFVNTTSGAITVTLPAGSAGSIVSLKDYANTWNTNNVTVTPDGTDKINGTNANATLDTQDQSVTLVYVDSTKGWRAVQDSTSDVSGALFITATGGTVTCCGDYKIHTFTGPGTFTVSCAGNAGGSNTLDYLVVAGGGGGGQVTEGGAGGGGAGGFRLSNATCMPAPLTSPLANASGLPVTVTGYPITIGAGGTGGTNGRSSPPASPVVNGTNGSNSIFSTITSSGGGFGGGGDFPYPGTSATPGNPGGSGGGGHANTTGAGGTGKGTGNTPPVSPPQGNDGALGVASDSDADAQNGGGGGGAGAAGVQASPTSPGAPSYTGGDGGIGSFVVSAGFAGCNGTTGPVCGARYFAGGGGGGRRSAPPTGLAGTGGDGGGADGQNGNVNATADSGTANTGGGGGAGGRGEIGPTSPSGGNGGAGGSGIVIIRYKYQ